MHDSANTDDNTDTDTVLLPALTQRDLDRMRCSDPECTIDHGSDQALGIFCRLHRDQGLQVSYTPGAGVITLRCPTCVDGMRLRVVVHPGNPVD